MRERSNGPRSVLTLAVGGPDSSCSSEAEPLCASHVIVMTAWKTGEGGVSSWEATSARSGGDERCKSLDGHREERHGRGENNAGNVVSALS